MFVMFTNSPLDIQTIEKVISKDSRLRLLFLNNKLVQPVVSDVSEVVQTLYVMFMKCDLWL